jgi:imidazolonepropionase-like amidohydrolase
VPRAHDTFRQSRERALPTDLRTPDAAPTTVFRGARVIDGLAEDARTGYDVVVTGDRITAVEAFDPANQSHAGARIIDASGATLLPGLIDCHAHYTIDPTVEDGFLLYNAERVEELVLRGAGMARRALEAGVTTARSAGSPANLDVVLSAAIAAGQVAGPRLMAAGPALTITGGHGYQFGREVDGELEFIRAVRANVRDGAEVIKVVASEAAMITTSVAGVEEVSEAELEAVVHEAERLHRRVLSHAQNSESVRRSARAGVASVEHAFLADEAALETLLEHRTTLVPTLTVTAVWHELGDLSPAARARQDEIERLHRRSCETAIRIGVPVATGTDTGVRGVMPEMLWREVVLLHDHGASPMQAIRAATSTAAGLLGIEDEVGTIEAGKLADLVLVDGDPLQDLSRLAHPRLVMHAGSLVPLDRS